ncbi:hypothetical protein TNCV_868291 [Trichonephila clavipes]|nr:hypothetical protein TNCV_868291 [Trichonephila clavipes]
MCSGCLANMKGPIIVLLISEVIPAPPAAQLDGNFRLFILPVSSTITLPNCDPHYPTFYSFRLNKALQYASPDCPANFEQTCSSCHGYSDAVLAKACGGGFAIVAEIEHAGVPKTAPIFHTARFLVESAVDRTRDLWIRKHVTVTYTVSNLHTHALLLDLVGKNLPFSAPKHPRGLFRRKRDEPVATLDKSDNFCPEPVTGLCSHSTLPPVSRCWVNKRDSCSYDECAKCYSCVNTKASTEVQAADRRATKSVYDRGGEPS